VRLTLQEVGRFSLRPTRQQIDGRPFCLLELQMQTMPSDSEQTEAPKTTNRATVKLGARLLPADLADAALIDGPTCAAVGAVSVSWWHE